MPEDTRELLPCPFCGGEADIKPDPGKCDIPFGLVVDHAESCFFAMLFKSDDEIATAWNTRSHTREDNGELVELLRRVERALTCGENCAHYCPNCDNSLFDILMEVQSVLSNRKEGL